MIQWGINSLNHGSSLAVFRYNELVSWKVSAEHSLPSDVVRAALEFGSPKHIYWYEQPWLKKLRQVRAGQYKTAMDMSVLPRKWIKDNNLNYSDVIYTPHHASHAAAGYYTSPFNHCAVVVLDAIGEFECATIWEGKHSKLKKVWSRIYPNSLGLFYSAFTKLISLTPLKDEYLLQKMSEQGDASRYYSEVSDYICGTVLLKKNLHRGVVDWPYPIETLQDQCDIAAAVQLIFQENVCKIMELAKSLTNSNSLVYMGGCAMNSAANKLIAPMWDNIWSLPDPGDASSSIGAVLYHTQHRVWDYKWNTAKHIEIKV